MKDGTKALEDLRAAYIDLFAISEALEKGGWKPTDKFALKIFEEKKLAVMNKIGDMDLVDATEKERFSIVATLALISLSNVYTGIASIESVEDTITVLVQSIIATLEITREELC